MRTRISILGAWGGLIALVWWGAGQLSWSAKRVMEESQLLLRALSSFCTQVSPLYLWTQAQQPISDLQRVSSYPRPLAGPCDRWPSACRYCTIFQFPAQEEEFKGLSEVQRHSVAPPAHKQPPASCRRPEVQTLTAENIPENQVLSVSTKQPLPPSRCLTDSSAGDSDRRPNSLCERSITKTREFCKSECSVLRVRPVFAWYWPVVLLTADMTYKGYHFK